MGVLFGLRPLLLVLFVFLAVSLFSEAKRKSGWGICGSSCFGGLLCFFGCSTLICLRIRTQLYKRLFDSLCSCKDRALARHRPNSRKKNKDLTRIVLLPFSRLNLQRPWLDQPAPTGAGLSHAGHLGVFGNTRTSLQVHQ